MAAPETHALLSASSAHRWLHCTRAPRVEEGLPETTSSYAEAGRVAHAIAELEGFETVTEEEFKAELKYWVDSYQGYMTEEEILAKMGEEVIRERAFSEKVQKWLLEKASFTFESAE